MNNPKRLINDKNWKCMRMVKLKVVNAQFFSEMIVNP